MRTAAGANSAAQLRRASRSPFTFGYSGGGPNHINTGFLNQCGNGLLASTGLVWDGSNHYQSFTTTINLSCGWAFYDGTQGGTIPSNYFDLYSVVAHELGHALGLCHSASPGLLMNAGLATGTVYSIAGDAAYGDSWIYNPYFVNPPPEGGCL